MYFDWKIFWLTFAPVALLIVSLYFVLLWILSAKHDGDGDDRFGPHDYTAL